jgi:hypothetical protein
VFEAHKFANENGAEYWIGRPLFKEPQYHEQQHEHLRAFRMNESMRAIKANVPKFTASNCNFILGSWSCFIPVMPVFSEIWRRKIRS